MLKYAQSIKIEKGEISMVFYFDSFTTEWLDELHAAKPSSYRTSVYQNTNFVKTNDTYSAKFKLAGFEPSEVKVFIADGKVTVTADKNPKDSVESYKFESTIPTEADTETLDALFKNGLLTVSFKAKLANRRHAVIRTE
jgi:HSP20 family molecular chaperone IbpA